jgi:hypothetical protein
MIMSMSYRRSTKISRKMKTRQAAQGISFAPSSRRNDGQPFIHRKGQGRFVERFREIAMSLPKTAPKK